MSLSINLVIETSTQALLVTSSPRHMDAHGSIYHVLSLHDKLGTSGGIIKHNNVLAFDLQPTNHHTCSITYRCTCERFRAASLQEQRQQHRVALVANPYYQTSTHLVRPHFSSVAVITTCAYVQTTTFIHPDILTTSPASP